MCKKRINLLLLPLLLAFYTNTIAQKINAKNAVFAEIGGKGIVYSLNFDRLFYQKNNLKLSARVGLGYIPETRVYSSALFVPISLNVMYGKKSNYVEISLGQTLRLYPSYNVQGVDYPSYTESPLTFIGLGYRYQKDQGGLFFTSTLLASFVQQENTTKFSPWLGLGIGKSF